MRRRRSRLALLGVFAMALSASADLTVDAAAAAKKKGGGGGGTKTLSKGSAAIPDSTVKPTCDGNGGCFNNGILSSRIVAGKKLKAAKLKDLNVRVSITHPDLSDIEIYLIGANGRVVSLSLFNDNNPFTPVGPPFFSLGKFGPATFDDDAPLYIDDTQSVADGDAPTSGDEAVAPYNRGYKPQEGTLASLGSRLFGTWTLVVFDNDPQSNPADPADVGKLDGWSLIAQLKGGGGGGKKK
jgi:subtilisin-like proprotein convertase family protein